MSSQFPRHESDADMSAGAEHAVQLSSVVLAVRELDSSIRFYRDLLGMDVAITDAGAALLVNADGFQLYLHALGKRADHASDSIGVRTVIWTAHDADDLRRCEHWLQEHDAHVQSWNADEYAMVEGRDPSGLPVLLVHPGPNQATRRAIVTRLYAI